MGRNRYLVKNTTMIGAGSFVAKITQFIVLSLCTHSMSTGEYGIADICVSTAALAYPIFSLDISESVFRFTIDKPQNEKSIISFSVCLSVIGGIIAFILTPVMVHIPQIGKYWRAIAILSVFESIQILFKEYTRGKENRRKYILSGVINACIQVTGCILLVYLFRYGVMGYFVSLALGYLAEFIYLAVSMDLLELFSIYEIDRMSSKAMLAYSLPLIPNTMMWWIVSISDRYFILYMKGDSEAGVYSVAAKVPALITVITGIFFKAWQMSAIEAGKHSDVSEYSSKVFNYLWLVSGICISGLLILLRPLLHILVAKGYSDAWIYSTILIVSAGFSTLQSFLGTSYTVHKDSIGCLKSTFIMALINIMLNYLFIRIWGVPGAAFSTLMSYIFVTVYRFYDTKKYLILEVDKIRLIVTYSLLIITAFIPLINMPFYYPVAIMSMLLLIFINKKDISVVIKLFMKMIGK